MSQVVCYLLSRCHFEQFDVSVGPVPDWPLLDWDNYFYQRVVSREILLDFSRNSETYFSYAIFFSSESSLKARLAKIRPVFQTKLSDTRFPRNYETYSSIKRLFAFSSFACQIRNNFCWIKLSYFFPIGWAIDKYFIN